MQTWANKPFQLMLDKYRNSALLAKQQDIIPYKSAGKQWAGSPCEGDAWWTGGFWAGLMWQFYQVSGDALFLEEARRVEKRLIKELEYFEVLCHDLGFLFMLSCGADRILTGNEPMKRHMLHAATLLAGRFCPTGHYIRAWNGKEHIGWAIIDCMMNLSLLFWASKETQDRRFADIACLHADTAIREFVREDGSCNHILVFDQDTGKVARNLGGQGYGEGSSWSRGQAWGLYGFTLCYLSSHERRFLDTACKIADYFIKNIQEHQLVNCDFRQPESSDKKDDIAAACAACGLLELSKLECVPNAKAYHQAAESMLRTMVEKSADWSEAAPGVLQYCTSAYHDPAFNTNIVYGDYFFAEALAKLQGTDRLFWLGMP